jgi:hypothetical protein
MNRGIAEAERADTGASATRQPEPQGGYPRVQVLFQPDR